MFILPFTQRRKSSQTTCSRRCTAIFSEAPTNLQDAMIRGSIQAAISYGAGEAAEGIVGDTNSLSAAMTQGAIQGGITDGVVAIVVNGNSPKEALRQAGIGALKGGASAGVETKFKLPANTYYNSNSKMIWSATTATLLAIISVDHNTQSGE